MTRRPCPTCRKQISIQAATCPGCGQPLEAGWTALEKKRGLGTGTIATLILGVGFLTVATLTAKPKSITVSAAEYGKEWPYRDHVSGHIKCKMLPIGESSRPVVTIELGGRTYGLNGAAIGAVGFPDSRTLLARDPASGVYQLGATSKFIEIGNKLCGK